MALNIALAQFDKKTRESLFQNVRSFYSANLNAAVHALQEALTQGHATLDNEHCIFTCLAKVEDDLASIYQHSNQLYASIISTEIVPLPAICQALSLLLATARLQPTFSQMTWRSTTILKTLSIMRLINGVPHWSKHLNERFKVSSAPEVVMSANEGLLSLHSAAVQFLSDTGKYPPPPLLMNLLTREQQNGKQDKALSYKLIKPLLPLLTPLNSSGDPSELLSACKSMAEVIIKAYEEIEILSEAAKEAAVSADRVAFQADPIAMAEIEAAAKERLKALEEKNKPQPTRDIFRKPENVMQVLDAPRRPSMDAVSLGLRDQRNDIIEEEEYLQPRTSIPLSQQKTASQSHIVFKRDSHAAPRQSIMANPYGEGELAVKRGPGGRVDRSFDLSGGLEGIQGSRGSQQRSHERWPHLMGRGGERGRRATSHSHAHYDEVEGSQAGLHNDYGHDKPLRRNTYDVVANSASSAHHANHHPAPLPPPPPPAPPAPTHATTPTTRTSHKSKKKEAEPAFVDTPLPPGIRPRLLSYDLKLTGPALAIVAKKEKEKEDRRRAEEEEALLATKNGWKRVGDKAQVVPPAVPLASLEVKLQESVVQQLRLIETHNLQMQQTQQQQAQQQTLQGGLVLSPSPPPPPTVGGGGRLVPQSMSGGTLVASPSPSPPLSYQLPQSAASPAPMGLSSFGIVPSSHTVPVHNAYQAPTAESLSRPPPPPPPPQPQPHSQPQPQPQPQPPAPPLPQKAQYQPQGQANLQQPQPHNQPMQQPLAPNQPHNQPMQQPLAPNQPLNLTPSAYPSSSAPGVFHKNVSVKSRMGQIQSQAASSTDDVYKAVARQLNDVPSTIVKSEKPAPQNIPLVAANASAKTEGPMSNVASTPPPNAKNALAAPTASTIPTSVPPPHAAVPPAPPAPPAPSAPPAPPAPPAPTAPTAPSAAAAPTALSAPAAAAPPAPKPENQTQEAFKPIAYPTPSAAAPVPNSKPEVPIPAAPQQPLMASASASSLNSEASRPPPPVTAPASTPAPAPTPAPTPALAPEAVHKPQTTPASTVDPVVPAAAPKPESAASIIMVPKPEDNAITIVPLTLAPPPHQPAASPTPPPPTISGSPPKTDPPALAS